MTINPTSHGPAAQSFRERKLGQWPTSSLAGYATFIVAGLALDTFLLTILGVLYGFWNFGFWVFLLVLGVILSLWAAWNFNRVFLWGSPSGTAREFVHALSTERPR